MIKPDQIPDAVVEAAVSAYDCAHSDVFTTAEQDMAVAIAVALNAWPGMDIASDDDWCSIRKGWITLPQKDVQNAEHEKA